MRPLHDLFKLYVLTGITLEISVGVKIMTHTPTPWVLEKSKDRSDYVIRDAKGNAIFGSAPYYPWVSEEDFPFIVRAVNAHDNMLKALHFVKNSINPDLRNMVLKAIALAEKPS